MGLTRMATKIVSDNSCSVKTVSELLEMIKSLAEKYPKNLIVNVKGNNFIFRGISTLEYELIPSVYREQAGERRSEFTPLPKGTTSANIITNRAYLYNDEDEILGDFTREATPLVNKGNMSRLKWMEIAQHYGAPTRLLDWTENPLVALYFIVSANREKPGRLWILHKNNYVEFLKKEDTYYKDIDEAMDRTVADRIIKTEKKEQPRYPYIYHPDYLDDRMASQSSCFMIWGKSKTPFEMMVGETNYMQYEKDYLEKAPRVGKQEYLEQFLLPVTIDAKYKISMLDELRVIGIHEKSVFPGLDGVGKYVERFHRNDQKYCNLHVGTYIENKAPESVDNEMGKS